MVNLDYDDVFEKKMSKLKDPVIKLKIKKQIAKIIESPEMGKPMQYERKGTRELYVPPFRLAYAYSKEENLIILLDFYHKDEQ